MSQEQNAVEAGPSQDADDMRLRRRSCIFRLLIIWFTIMVLVIVGIIFVRSNAIRDPGEVLAKTGEYVRVGQLPQGFYPYSHTSFFGMSLSVFYHEKHIREDGRTTSIVAVNIDSRFEGESIVAARNQLFKKLETRLEKREFKVRNRNSRKVMQNGQEIEIFIFEGTHLMEKDHLPATTCYRFLEGPEGPIYIHTMGLNRSFGVEDQIKAHLAFEPLARQ